jgi:cell filamentation protein
MTDRYDTTGHPEGQHQPGSDEKVLLNKPGITDPDVMDDVELELLEKLTESVLNEVEEDQRITTGDLCEWHRRWLGNVYDWAGKYRSVNMGKGEFQFAAAHLIPKLMDDFEKKFLSVHTPCNEMDNEELIQALANVHIEYILVHPFREGVLPRFHGLLS